MPKVANSLLTGKDKIAAKNSNEAGVFRGAAGRIGSWQVQKDWSADGVTVSVAFLREVAALVSIQQRLIWPRRQGSPKQWQPQANRLGETLQRLEKNCWPLCRALLVAGMSILPALNGFA